MKWDVKHDRAKKVLNHFLDNAGYWTETESLTEGLTEDEILEEHKKRYWTAERAKAQPYEAYKLNTEIVIRQLMNR